MRKILFILTIIGAFTLNACNNVSLEDKVNKNTFRKDIAVFTENKLITEEEKKLLTSLIACQKPESKVFSHSYAEILSYAKEKEMIEKIKEKSKRDFTSSSLGRSF